MKFLVLFCVIVYIFCQKRSECGLGFHYERENPGIGWEVIYQEGNEKCTKFRRKECDEGWKEFQPGVYEAENIVGFNIVWDDTKMAGNNPCYKLEERPCPRDSKIESEFDQVYEGDGYEYIFTGMSGENKCFIHREKDCPGVSTVEVSCQEGQVEVETGYVSGEKKCKVCQRIECGHTSYNSVGEGCREGFIEISGEYLQQSEGYLYKRIDKEDGFEYVELEEDEEYDGQVYVFDDSGDEEVYALLGRKEYVVFTGNEDNVCQYCLPKECPEGTLKIQYDELNERLDTLLKAGYQVDDYTFSGDTNICITKKGVGCPKSFEIIPDEYNTEDLFETFGINENHECRRCKCDEAKGFKRNMTVEYDEDGIINGSTYLRDMELDCNVCEYQKKCTNVEENDYFCVRCDEPVYCRQSCDSEEEEPYRTGCYGKGAKEYKLSKDQVNAGYKPHAVKCMGKGDDEKNVVCEYTTSEDCKAGNWDCVKWIVCPKDYYPNSTDTSEKRSFVDKIAADKLKSFKKSYDEFLKMYDEEVENGLEATFQEYAEINNNGFCTQRRNSSEVIDPFTASDLTLNHKLYTWVEQYQWGYCRTCDTCDEIEKETGVRSEMCKITDQENEKRRLQALKEGKDSYLQFDKPAYPCFTRIQAGCKCVRSFYNYVPKPLCNTRMGYYPMDMSKRSEKYSGCHRCVQCARKEFADDY